MVEKRQKVDNYLMIVAVVAVVAIVSLIINSADIMNFSEEKLKKIENREFCGECSILVRLSKACDAEAECGGPCSEFDYLTVDSCVDFANYWYVTQGSVFVFGPQWDDAAIESKTCSCCYDYDITYCAENRINQP